MRNFSVKAQLIYFGGIALVSIAFFVLQLYGYQSGDQLTWELMLLILWGIIALFGIGGFFYSISKRKR